MSSFTLFTIISAVWLVLASASSAPTEETPRPVLLRLFADFAHVYRSVQAKALSDYSSTDDLSADYYNISFPVSEYEQISEESLSMLNTRVLERTIVFHSEPNFQRAGARYFYRRDPKQDEAVEIELVDPRAGLFREVLQPNRSFYLNSHDGLQYADSQPMLPYYDVSFKCLREQLQRYDEYLPTVTYHDQSLGWSARYILDVPLIGTTKNVPLLAYADIRNRADYPLLLKQVELAAGDVKLLDKSDRETRSHPTLISYSSAARTEGSGGSSDYKTVSLGEQGSGIYAFEIRVLSNTILPAQSVRSVPLTETDMSTKSFVLYSSFFATSNGQDKLIRAYNLSSVNQYLPAGRWILREQGRLLGEVQLPALARSEVYTMKFGPDPDVSYRRLVTILEQNQQNETITYQVEYFFLNAKELREVNVDFRESFAYLPYFEMKNIVSQPQQPVQPLQMFGSELRGEFVLPRNQGGASFTYQVIVYQKNPKDKQ